MAETERKTGEMFVRENRSSLCGKAGRALLDTEAILTASLRSFCFINV